MCCNKFFLFTTNIIVFVIGVVVIGLSSAIIHKSLQFDELLFDGAVSLPIWLLILGLFVTIVGFLGCLGALKENKCMLYTYSFILLALFIGEVVLAAMLVANPEAIKDKLGDFLDNQYGDYGTGGVTSTTKSIDSMQQDLQCCGVNGPSDWADEDWNSGTIPGSCCSDPTFQDTCTNPLKNPFVKSVGGSVAYPTGCLQAMIDEFQGMFLALGIIAFILAIVIFINMSIACGLAKNST